MKRLEGKVAIVTGAAGAGSGQGRNHAQLLASEGARVLATDKVDPSETVELVRASGGTCVGMLADVTSPDDMREQAERAVAEFGRIDVVVANAGGVAGGAPIWELPEEDWDATHDMDLKGAWLTCKYSIPHMIAGGGGSIVLTESIQALRPWPSITHYVAARHGGIGLMKGLANELGQHRIRVNAICPGSVIPPDGTGIESGKVRHVAEWEGITPQEALDGFDRMNLLPDRWIPLSAFSNAVLFLASEESAFVTGLAIPVDAGWHIKAGFNV